MGTKVEKALRELSEFLEAEDIYFDDDVDDGIKAFIKAYNRQGDDLSEALDDVDKLQCQIADADKEMEVFIGEHDTARSLWNRIQNLCSEFNIPSSQRPSQIGLDFTGCERIVDLLAMKVRNGKTPRSGWGN